MRIRTGVPQQPIRIVSLLIASMAGAAALPAAEGRPIGNHALPRPPGVAQLAVPEASTAELLQCLLGPGVSATNVTLTAAPQAAGTFAGALSVIGFDQGIILSSGDVNTLTGPNLGDYTSTDNLAKGDPDLEALIPGYTTFDAVVLEFDFSCDTAQDVVFQYVFGSEEYNEYVNSPFNDVFGFFLNAANIAVAPAGCSAAGAPVSINNVNCGNPYVGAGPNCNCFRNNDLNDGGPTIDTELDGLLQVFHATGTIQPGLNHIKIALSDAGDPVLDSDVMIRCQSFTCGTPPVIGACCLPAPGGCVTLASADCAANGGTYNGDGTSCAPGACGTSAGACCHADLSCEVESADSCAQIGGSYQGEGTPCVPNPCGAPLGACCFGSGVCEISDQFSCVGAFMGPDTDCSPDPCGGLTGACCADAATTCELKTQDDCHDTFLGVGTDCADLTPCEELLGACCHDTGVCEIVFGNECGDTYMGNRTVCDPNPCAGDPNEIFSDGFELGTTSAWDSTVP